ncbi:CHALLAH / EPIDERMAL PATTERNING FACTOR-LIKE protein 6 [Zostera marina]|uniref:Epidermal patterning factor-like protein n=1 Tax=Zostera marina TaxID=29655 RepID=A0A0K9PE63_ZOSMR|nr:CHALLAH / EPIDERMAL PATTERNING FACTOR-LIKE protein 6 [Zostera marina]
MRSMELRRRDTIFCILFLLLCLMQVSIYSVMLETDGSTTDGEARRQQKSNNTGEEEGEETKWYHLGGPGSYPPRCRSKCGHCSPCRPVHVTVPPGTPVTTEYYPEAWRCKCGNRLYLP